MWRFTSRTSALAFRVFAVLFLAGALWYFHQSTRTLEPLESSVHLGQMLLCVIGAFMLSGFAEVKRSLDDIENKFRELKSPAGTQDIPISS